MHNFPRTFRRRLRLNAMTTVQRRLGTPLGPTSEALQTEQLFEHTGRWLFNEETSECLIPQNGALALIYVMDAFFHQTSACDTVLSMQKHLKQSPAG